MHVRRTGFDGGYSMDNDSMLITILSTINIWLFSGQHKLYTPNTSFYLFSFFAQYTLHHTVKSYDFSVSDDDDAFILMSTLFVFLFPDVKGKPDYLYIYNICARSCPPQFKNGENNISKKNTKKNSQIIYFKLSSTPTRRDT